MHVYSEERLRLRRIVHRSPAALFTCAAWHRQAGTCASADLRSADACNLCMEELVTRVTCIDDVTAGRGRGSGVANVRNVTDSQIII